MQATTAVCERNWLFAGAGNVAVARPERSPQALVDRVRRYVLAHIERAIPLDELGIDTGVGVQALQRAILTATGQSIGDFITHVRMERARALLSSNREFRTQAELAEALGLGSGAAFARNYRKRFGETISQTRCRAAYASIPIVNLRK